MGDDKKLEGMKGEWNVTTSSPYYLGSGDQPGNVITHIIFTGENYVADVGKSHDVLLACST